MKQTKSFFLLMALLMLSFFAENCIAGDWIKPGEELFRIDAGAFFATIDTNVRVDNNDFGEGSNINLEDDLGFDDTTTSFILNGYWRFAKRHRLFAGYFTIDRDTSGQLDQDLDIGGDIYPIGANFTSDFDFKVIPIAYGYSFVSNEKHEFTGILGAHWYQVNFAISAYASGGSGELHEQTSVDADVPLPMIGFSYEYRFTDRWIAGATAQAFYLDTSGGTFDFSGSLLNLGIRTEYWIFNNIGIGASLDYFRLDVDVEDDNWKGSLDYQYFGPKVYVSVRF